ncbi:hypothetical protein AK830_g3360 [Neonectria ditissima]|uniref:MARVEL domain-containing protein n=1 Tax=Neonectria ditissima TaxID=78410 RepID=A0A0P7BQD0_9HYPO|nr:hypothetical protein AK830_g3360 [Neonectria ditissima]
MSEHQHPLLPQGDGVPIPHISSTRMWLTKLTLRICSIVTCANILRLEPRVLWIHWTIRPDWFICNNVFALTLLLSIAWNLAESIYLLARRGHRGIHPGACVGVDLVLAMADLVLCFLAAFASSPFFPDAPRHPEDEEKYARAGAVYNCTCIEWFLHVTLFIIACTETRTRRRISKALKSQYGYGATATSSPSDSSVASA